MSLLFGANTTDKVNHGSAAAMDNLTTLTIWAWVYRTTNGGAQIIASKSNVSTGWVFLAEVQSGEGCIRFLIRRATTDSDFISNTLQIPLNTWTFVAATWDDAATPKVKLYKGSLSSVVAEVSSYQVSTAGSGTPVADASQSFCVGNADGGTLPFLGRIQRGALVSSILTLKQLREVQIATSLAACNVTNTQTLWEYNSTSDYATDQSGNGNTGTLTGATTATVTPFPILLAVTNSNVYFSPYNWGSDGGGALAANNIKGSSTYGQSNTPGAYAKFKVTVASGAAGGVFIAVDPSLYTTLTASKCPTIYYSVDDGTFSSQLLATDTPRVALAGGLASGTHTIQVFFKSIALNTPGDRWTTPLQAIKATTFFIDSDAVTASQTLRTKNAIFFGDSSSEGAAVVGVDTLNANNDATQAFCAAVARAFDAEYGQIAFGGQGFERGIDNQTAGSGNPSFYNSTAANQSWDRYYNGASRLVSGALSPVPDYIFIEFGGNDATLSSSSVTSVIDAIRTAAGVNCWIFVLVNHLGSKASEITTGVNNAASTAKTKLIQPDVLFAAGVASLYSDDSAVPGSHLNIRGHAHYAAEVAALAQAQISAASGSAGVRLAVLSGGMRG